jgi:hypothetical protein
MEEKVNEMLEEAIIEELFGLSNLQTGSKEKTDAVEDLVKLYKLRIEEIKTELEFNEKIERRLMECEQYERDEQLKKRQASEQMRDRYFKLGVDAAGIMLPLIFYAAWMRKGFEFEETGTFTSTTFRNLVNRVRPTIK